MRTRVANFQVMDRRKPLPIKKQLSHIMSNQLENLGLSK